MRGWARGEIRSLERELGVDLGSFRRRQPDVSEASLVDTPVVLQKRRRDVEVADRESAMVDVTKASAQELKEAFAADVSLEGEYLAAAREGRLEQPAVKSEAAAAPSLVFEAFSKAAREEFPRLPPTEALDVYLNAHPQAEELLAEAMRRGL